MHGNDARFQIRPKMKAFLSLLLATLSISQAAAQPAGNPRAASRTTMAALLADGFEPAAVQIFKDKIWMRKDTVGGLAYICDRGRLGTATFDAYREKKYDQISCSLTQ
jgi:hypothetical protein